MRPNSPKAWLLAARPKTLTAALIPVILGSALAFADRKFQTEEAVLCLLFACLMQVAANFINDLFDFRKGSAATEVTVLVPNGLVPRDGSHRTP